MSATTSRSPIAQKCSTSRRRAGTKPGSRSEDRRYTSSAAAGISQPLAQDLALPVQRGRAPRRLGVEPPQPAAHVRRRLGEIELVVRFQQQLQRGRPSRVLRQHQLQVVARRLPLLHLGVHGAQPLPDVEQLAGGVDRQQAQHLLQALHGGLQIAARARQLGERLARPRVLRIQDRELAIQRLGLGGVARPVGQRGAPVHQQLARDDVGGVGRRVQRPYRSRARVQSCVR